MGGEVQSPKYTAQDMTIRVKAWTIYFVYLPKDTANFSYDTIFQFEVYLVCL